MKSLILAAVFAAGFPPAWAAPAGPFRVVGDLYEVGSAGISTFALKTSAGVVLLDAGMADYAPHVLENLKAVGVQPSDVKVILTSHAHFDHAGGLAALRRATGAKVEVMAQDVKADETGTYAGYEDKAAFRFPPVTVDRVLHDGDTVTLGGETMTALLTPGHTAGCTSWTFPVRENGLTYRVIYACSMGVGANRIADRPQYRGVADDYRRTFATLKGLHADVYLTAHAEQFDLAAKKARIAPGAPNPFVDPTELSRRVAAAQAAFETELKAQQGGKDPLS